MRPSALVAIGIVAYAAFLVATLPASFVAERVQALSDGRVAIDDPRGTAWSGEARVAVATPGGRIAFDRVAWDWNPLHLLGGKFAYDVVAGAPGIEVRLQAARTPTRWAIEGLEAKANAAAVVAAMPWIGAWRPEGNLAASAARVTTDGSDLLGDARIEWHAAAVALADVKPLGSYRAEVTGQGASARIAIATIEGPLQVAAQGTLRLPSRLELNGEARATGPRAGNLEGLLDLMGPRRPDGARTIRWPVR